MADLIVAAALMALTVLAAEAVRRSCRRMLRAPVHPRRAHEPYRLAARGDRLAARRAVDAPSVQHAA